MSLLKCSLLSIALVGALGARAQPCLVDYLFTASTPPVNGTYACGQTVTFCYTVTFWNTTNANWFHGIVASFGPGWDMSTLVTGPPPPPCGPNPGTWGWYNSVQGTATTATGPQGPGFFFDLDNDGDPGNNFGDYCTGVVNWQFCWTISVLGGPACINGLGLDVTVNTFGDSETGSWSSTGCTGDAVVPSTPAVIQNCAANAGTGGPLALCSTSPATDLFAQLGNNPDAGGSWTDATGAPHASTFDPAVDVQGSYTYTVGTIVPPCTSSSVIAVSVSPQPDAGIDGVLTTCASSPAANLINSLGGSPDPGGTWTGPGGGSSGVFNPAADPAGVYTYTIAGVAPCANASANVTVNVNLSPNAGSNGLLTVCSNGIPESLFTYLGGAPSAGGTWTDPNNVIVGGTFTPGSSIPGVYTYTVAGVAPCPNSSATITVTENVAPDAGNDAAALMCNTDGLTSLVTLLNGSPDPGGTWTDPGGNIVPDLFDMGSGATGVYTYSIAGIAPCANAQASLDLLISQQPTAGANGNLNLCQASPVTDLFTALGGAPDPGGTWTDASGTAVPALFDPLTGASGVYTYTLAAVAPCLNATATVLVNVSAQPTAGTDAVLALCSSTGATALFPQLGPNAQPGGTWTDGNGAATTGQFTPGSSIDGTYTYTVAAVPPCPSASATVDVSTVTAADPGIGLPLDLCDNGGPVSLGTSLGGTPDPGGSWTTPSGGASNGTINPANAAPGNYTYTIAAIGPCPAVSTSVLVSIVPAPDAGVDGQTQLCSDAAAYGLINGLGGTPSAGGTWMAPNGSPHGASFDPTSDAQGIYTYTVTAPPPCVSASSTVIMGIVTAANAGSGGSASLCESDAIMDPFTWLAGNPDVGGTWTSPSGATIANIDPATAATGVYTYTVNGTAPCPDAQATVDITIDQLPNAGIDNTAEYCADANAQDLIVLLAGAQPGGTWIGPAGAATGIFIPGTNLPGTYTYSVSGIGACVNENDQATVDVTVNDLPVPIFSMDTTLGCAPLTVAFTNDDAPTATSVVWSFGDGATDNAIANSTHTYADGGSYDVSLEVTDANGCIGTLDLSDTIHVSTGPEAYFYALPWRVSVNTPTTQVTHIPDDGVSYIWQLDSALLDTSGAFAWTFDPATVGMHPICLTSTDTLGCENTYCIEILVDDDLTIYVPNAFTPNGDDDNDFFKPSIIGVQADRYEFMVFDRWGLIVFRTTDPAEAWNGCMDNSGDILPDGVYVWTVKAKDQFTPQKAEMIGSVTLVK